MPNENYSCTFYFDKLTDPNACDEDFSCIVTYNSNDGKMKIYDRKNFQCSKRDASSSSLSANPPSEYEIKGTFLNSPYNVEFEFSNQSENTKGLSVYYLIDSVSDTPPRCISEKPIHYDILKSQLGKVETLLRDVSRCFDMVDVCQTYIDNKRCTLENSNDNELTFFNTAVKATSEHRGPECVNERDEKGFGEFYHGKYDRNSFQMKAKFNVYVMAGPNICGCQQTYNCYQCTFNCVQVCQKTYKDFYIRLQRNSPNKGIQCVKEKHESTKKLEKLDTKYNLYTYYFEFFKDNCPDDLKNFRISHKKIKNGVRMPIVGGEYLERKTFDEQDQGLEYTNLINWPGIDGCITIVPRSVGNRREYQIFPCTNENNHYENFNFKNKVYGAVRFSFNDRINSSSTIYDHLDKKYFTREEEKISRTATTPGFVDNTIKEEVMKDVERTKELNERLHVLELYFNNTMGDIVTRDVIKKFREDLFKAHEQLKKDIASLKDIAESRLSTNIRKYDIIHKKVTEINKKVEHTENLINRVIINSSKSQKEESEKSSVDLIDEKSHNNQLSSTNDTMNIKKDANSKPGDVKYNFSNNQFVFINKHESRKQDDTSTAVQSEGDNKSDNMETNTRVESTNKTLIGETNQNFKEEHERRVLEVEPSTDSNNETKSDVPEKGNCSTCHGDNEELEHSQLFKINEDECIKPEDVNEIVKGNMNFGKSVIGGNSFMDIDDLQYNDYINHLSTEGENFTDNTCFLGATPCIEYPNDTLASNSSSSLHRNHYFGGILLLFLISFLFKRLFIK